MTSEKRLVRPANNPRIRILSYREHVEEIEEGLKEILHKNDLLNISTFRRGEPFSVEVRYQDDPVVVPVFLIINVLPILRDVGVAITIGRTIFDIVDYLRKRRKENKVYRFTINCSSNYFVALNSLRMQGVTIGQSLYFHSFGWHCLVIASDVNRPSVVHVVIYSNEGELEDYSVLTL